MARSDVIGVTSNDFVQLGIGAEALETVAVLRQRPCPKQIPSKSDALKRQLLARQGFRQNRVLPMRSTSGKRLAVPQNTERRGMRSVPLPFCPVANIQERIHR